MSRVVSHTDNFPCIGCDETNFNLASTTWSSNFTSTNYKYDNLKNVASSTTYARVNVKMTANADSYLYLLFDFSSIPNGATITNTIGKVRLYGNGNQVSRKEIRWCVGDINTPLRTSQSYSSSSNPTAITLEPLLTGISVEDTKNIKCYVHYLRSNRNDGSQRYIYIYGADVTVGWEETLYEVNVSSDSQTVTISASENETTGGGTNTITLTNVSSLSAIQLIDNGDDVTSSLVASGSNYIYTLSNVSADHTITVSDVQTGASMYSKSNGIWVQKGSLYKKINGAWVQQEVSPSMFSDGIVYVRGQ